MSISFKSFASSRPERYRTPSPPLYAIEPLSPAGFTDATVPPYYNHNLGAEQSYPGFDHSSRNDAYTSRSNTGTHNHRSHGSMELFATIALATQPFTSPLQSSNTNGKRLSETSLYNQPPLKRARSEKLPSSNLAASAVADRIRPATSYEIPVMDAELLLHFSQHPVHLKASTPVTSTGGLAQPPVPEVQSSALKELTNTGQVGSLSDPSLPAAQHQEDVNDHAMDDSLTDDFSYVEATPHTDPVITEPVAPESSKNVGPNEHCQGGEPSDSLIETALNEQENDLHTGDNSATSLELASDIANDAQDQGVQEPQHHEKQHSHNHITNNLEHQPGTASTEDVPPQTTPVTEDIQQAEPTPAEDSNASQIGDNLGSADQVETANIELPEMVDSFVSQPEKQVSNNLSEDKQSQGTKEEPPVSADVAEPASRSANSTAVCACCNFTRNSASVDNENNATSWINCDGCKSWYHFACAGFKNEREVRSVDKFRCKKCKPVHGATTYVRKSSRAHSAIDYAGLHQGVIKTSDDRPEHHYIQPIKDGTISFQPETFARMRPELITAEYFEKGCGMKEPIVIPAAFNPQPGAHHADDVMQEHSDHLPGRPDTLESSASLEEWFSQDPDTMMVPDEGQDALDMVMPRNLTVRKVSELYGPEEKVEVIDVKSQNGENKKWNMRRFVDYYESSRDNKIVRNVISLEVSQSKLGRLIRRPKIVRDLDLQDSVWPQELSAKGEWPRVQFYCLMSVADCFTDFHIDFGGSSVFYHILKGKKTFLFIPPKEKHLKKYEEWCMSPAQNWTFLADQTKECYRVDLSEGDTMLIPSGWIHAVWTPEDSLVIGGNFLTRMNFAMQIRIAQVEKNTGVARKFRYPHFQKIQWFTVLQYLKEDPVPDSVRERLERGDPFLRERPAHHDFDNWGENSLSGPENYHARYYSQSEIDGLPDLLRYILRTVMIDMGNVDGVTAEARNAVKKSIPRGHGDPIDIAKTFAHWMAWKRGNEPLQHWVYADHIIKNTAPEKLSTTAARKLAEEAAKAPRRQSARMQSQKNAAVASAQETQPVEVEATVPSVSVTSGAAKRTASEALDESVSMDNLSSPAPKKVRTSSGSTGSHRKTACESCRRRRRACKHKDQVEAATSNGQALNPLPHTTSSKPMIGTTSLQEKLSSIGDLFNAVTPKMERGHSQISSNGARDAFSGSSTTDQHANKGNVSHSRSVPGQEIMSDMGIVSGGSSPSKPRTKACHYCRKSKVRILY